MNNKVRHIILLAIVLVSTMATGQLHASDDRLYEYAARSVSVQKLQEFSDLLHIVTHNRHSDVLLDPVPIGSRLMAPQGCRVSFESLPTLIGLDGPEFIERFADGFEPMNPLASPLYFSRFSFSNVEAQDSEEIIEVSGLVSVSGAFKGTASRSAMPFRALMVVERANGVKCTLKEFIAGSDRHPILPISYTDMQSLHNEVFLDPVHSPLVEKGLCEQSELNALCDRMIMLERRSTMAEELKTRTGWNSQTIHERMATAQIMTLEVLRSLPHFLPPGDWFENDGEPYQGEEAVAELIDQFEIDRWSVPSTVQAVLNDHRDAYDVVRIQALSIRAWHYLLSDRMASPLLFSNDMEKASVYPVLAALEIVNMLGQSVLRDYTAAQESMRRLATLGPHTVLRHFMHESHGKLWQAHGQDMLGYHEHDEALMSLYIGSRFKTTVDELRSLADEASKMGENGLVVDCLLSILSIDHEVEDAGFWLDLSLAKARLGIDPAADVVNVEALEKRRTAHYYQVMSLYQHYSGRTDEADELLSEAQARFGEDPAILSALAEIDRDPMSRRKLLRRMVDKQASAEHVTLFKYGVIDHRTANADSLVSKQQQRELYKDAIYNYLDAVHHGFDRTLGYTKVAEAYVSIDDLSQATFYYNRAVSSQDRSMSVYFVQALLNLSVGNMSEFSDDLHLAEQKGIEDEGSERDVSLFRFMENLDDINTLISLADANDATTQKKRLRIDELSNTVKDRITEMFFQLTPQDSAHAAFSRVMLESIRGYVERDPKGNRARYRENNIQDEDVIEMMERSSDIPLELFKENPMMALLSKWNREFEKKIVRRIDRPDARTGLEYLQQSRLFSDPYNYL